jgi:hypothetical protein
MGYSNDWNTLSNWGCNQLPTAITNVTIPTTPDGGYYFEYGCADLLQPWDPANIRKVTTGPQEYAGHNYNDRLNTICSPDEVISAIRNYRLPDGKRQSDFYCSKIKVF